MPKVIHGSCARIMRVVSRRSLSGDGSRSPVRYSILRGSYPSSPVSPSLRGIICKWKCGTDCPASFPSFHTQLNPSAPYAFRSAAIMVSARSNIAVRSSGVKSPSFATQRRGAISTCPGVIGMLVGNTHAYSLSITLRSFISGIVQYTHPLPSCCDGVISM